MVVPKLTQEALDAVDYCRDSLEQGEVAAVDASLPIVLDALEAFVKEVSTQAKIADMYKKQSIYWFTAYIEQAAKRVEEQAS